MLERSLRVGMWPLQMRKVRYIAVGAVLWLAPVGVFGDASAPSRGASSDPACLPFFPLLTSVGETGEVSARGVVAQHRGQVSPAGANGVVQRIESGIEAWRFSQVARSVRAGGYGSWLMETRPVSSGSSGSFEVPPPPSSVAMAGSALSVLGAWHLARSARHLRSRTAFGAYLMGGPAFGEPVVALAHGSYPTVASCGQVVDPGLGRGGGCVRYRTARWDVDQAAEHFVWAVAPRGPPTRFTPLTLL